MAVQAEVDCGQVDVLTEQPAQPTNAATIGLLAILVYVLFRLL